MRELLLITLLSPGLAAAEWKHQTAVDPMTDEKSCRVIPEGQPVPYPLFYFAANAYSISVVGGDFPGRAQTLRVDRNKAESELDGLSGIRAQRIVKQIMAGGKTLRARSYKWPKDISEDTAFDLTGIVEHIKACILSIP